MRIAVIHGSLKGKTTNTTVMVNAFLKGAQAAGAETANIFLAEKEIKHCRSSHSYWFHHPEQCITKYDMAESLAIGAGTNVIALATPIYFENISSMLNAFIDHLTKTGDPYFSEDNTMISSKVLLPKLMIISSCGSLERSEIQIISFWIKRLALKMHTEVIGEIYAAQGRFLTGPAEKLRPAISSYLDILEKAGKEIATNLKLSEATKNLLDNKITPENDCKTINRR